MLDLKSYRLVIMVQWLYRLAVEEVPENDYMLPLSEAEVCYFILALVTFFFLSNYEVCTSKTQVIQEGSDITLVGWGAQLSIMQQAIMEAEKVSLR